MASLQERNGRSRVRFCHHRKLHPLTIGRASREEAEAKAAQVDYRLVSLI